MFTYGKGWQGENTWIKDGAIDEKSWDTKWMHYILIGSCNMYTSFLYFSLLFYILGLTII